MSENEIYKKAIETYGESAQIDMAIEEMSELILELMHYKRNRVHYVTSEMADVSIMLEQLVLIFDNAEMLRQKRLTKIDGLRERLSND